MHGVRGTGGHVWANAIVDGSNPMALLYDLGR